MRLSMPARSVLAALCLLAASSLAAAAQETGCPLPGQKPMLIVQLFFGQSIAGRAPLSPQEWAEFLRRTVTPRFPDGFTVYDAYGQWQDPGGQRIARQKTKVVMIATEDSPATRSRIDEVSRAYRTQFRQQSVGLVTNTACAAF